LLHENFPQDQEYSEHCYPGDLVTSDEGSPPKAFGMMADAVLVYSPRQWTVTP
jgi:hypothetical protein